MAKSTHKSGEAHWACALRSVRAEVGDWQFGCSETLDGGLVATKNMNLR